MIGQENNSSKTCSSAQSHIWSDKGFHVKKLCPKSWDKDDFITPIVNNTKSNWPLVFKMIPGDLPAHDASFCI